MKRGLLFTPIALLIASGAVSAQEAQPAPAPTPQDQQIDIPASADVSDEEVGRFALAALVVEQIAADESLAQDDKQQAMYDAVEQVGIEPPRFNALARASQTDPAMAERVRVAAAGHLEAAQQDETSR